MARLTSVFVLAASLFAATAYAESQAEIAARENEEGKQLMFENKYAEASAKFASAHARSAEPKYFFNHCTSLFWEGKYGEAVTACNAADKNADDALKKKIAALVEKIQGEAKKQNIDLQPAGGGGGPGDMPPNGGEQPPNGGDPNQLPPNGGQPPMNGAGPSMAVGRPPSVGLFSSGRPENKYTWSIGLDIFGGGGRIGRQDMFGTSSGGARFKADYLLNPKQRLGVQGYFQLSSFGEGDDVSGFGPANLSIFDIGVAGFKHFCGPRSRLCITPLAGIQLAMLSPGDEQSSTGDTVFNYASLGFRFEAALQYMLGSRYEHVIGIQAGLNIYTKAFSEPMDGGPTAAEWGLDKGGRAGYFGVGYTYRFNTPFGSTPFVTLE
jgi:hypothetical protein